MQKIQRQSIKAFCVCIKFITITPIALLLCLGSRAQRLSAQHQRTEVGKSHFVLGMDYLSDNVYQGRKDSIASPYLSTVIGYYHKSGFFLNGSASYLLSPGQNRFDLISIEGGYSHYTDHLNLEVEAARDFYSDESYSVSSEIHGRFSTYISFDFNFIEPSLDLGASFGDSHDLGLDLALAHNISCINDQLVISPTLHMNAGTQNYYSNYFAKRRYSPNRGKSSSISKSAKVEDPSHFQIMDYELSIPAEFSLKDKIKLSMIPTYVIPVNPLTITTETKNNGAASSSTAEEILKNSFFIQLGVRYRL